MKACHWSAYCYRVTYLTCSLQWKVNRTFLLTVVHCNVVYCYDLSAVFPIFYAMLLHIINGCTVRKFIWWRSMWRNVRPFPSIGLTLRHIELCNIASSVAYREIRQNFSNSVDYTYGQLTVDSVAWLEVGHGRLGGAPRAEGRERQDEACGHPKKLG